MAEDWLDRNPMLAHEVKKLRHYAELIQAILGPAPPQLKYGATHLIDTSVTQLPDEDEPRQAR